MAGPIRIAITASGRQARAEIRGVATETDLLGRSFARTGKLLAAGFAVDRLVRGAAAVYSVGSQYVETLNKVGAITGSTQTQLDKAATTLEGQSKQYGKMGETASDAADGVLELTKSGLSLNKALKAVYPTLVLAKSGQLEVSDASALVSNTLNSFNLRASRAGDIANFLANAADASSADVADLAESFKYVAPLASKAGLGLGQTNAILAELANSGIKASQAGTSLRKFLIALQAPTTAANISLDEMGVKIFDAGGKMKPVGQIIKDLSAGLDGLANDQDRAYALKNLFGLTGITGAQVILKGGVQGLKDYSESVRRAGGAARLANATSKGLSGTLNQLKAETITTAEAMYRKYSPAIDDVIRADLPKALNLAKDAAHQLQPTAEHLSSAVQDFGQSAAEVATGPIGHTFVAALKLTANVTGQVAAVLDSVPEPLRKIGIEAGVAALVLPRLVGGLDSIKTGATNQVASLKALRAELTTTRAMLVLPTTGAVPTSFSGLQIPPSTTASNLAYANSIKLVETQSFNARAALAKLAPAAKQAAGIGGFLALTAGAQQSNAALSTLETTLGAAALGFSVSGPVGGAIAGAGALVYELGTKFELTGQAAQQAYRKIAAKDATADAIKTLDDLKSTLDQVTGAYTGATRAATLKLLTDNNSIAIGAKYGLSAREVVNAALGQKGALSALTPIVSDYTSQIAALTAQQQDLARNPNNFDDAGFIPSVQKQYVALAAQKKQLEQNRAELQNFSTSLQGNAREVRQTAAATADYSGKLKGIPAAARSKIEADGIVATTRGVAKIAAQYRLLDKKQIKTLISASGADTTVKQVQRVVASLNKANQTKATLPLFKSGVLAAVSDVAKSAQQGSTKVASNLKNGTSKAKANLNPFQTSVRSGVSSATGTASTGGKQVGSALQEGVISGFAGTQARLAAAAAAAVGAAIAAAKARAKVNSPSKETQYIGQMMGAGLAVGLSKSSSEVNAAATQLTAGLLAALTDQSPIAANLQTISDYVSSQFDSTLETSSKSIDRRYDQVQRVLDQRYKTAQARIKKTLKGKAEDKALQRAENAHDKLSTQIDRARTKSQSAATKASKAAQDAALQATAAQRQALAVNIQQQKDVTAAYEQQSDALQALVDQSQQYADGIRDAVQASGSLSTLAQAGATSLTRLLKQRSKAAADAKQFQADIAALTTAGLNAYDLKDITDQGATAGLKIAEALLKGGPDAVAQMNALSAQLEATGQQLGDSTAKTLYGAGITAAQGLVDGLAAQKDALAVVATTLGAQIAAGLAAGLAAATGQATTQAGKTSDEVTKKVKKKFKTHSPSKVFEDIGVNVVQGLANGLAQRTYVTRQSTRLADSVTSGFGTPALDAFLAARQASAAAQPAVASTGRDAPLIGNVTMQQGESVDAFAEKLWFKLRTRG